MNVRRVALVSIGKLEKNGVRNVKFQLSHCAEHVIDIRRINFEGTKSNVYK